MLGGSKYRSRISLKHNSISIELMPSLDSNENFKGTLLASLYAQVDFLKNRNGNEPTRPH